MVDPESFGFPFEPYSIQKDFMKELYKVLSDGKIGIFESPTGTVRFFLHIIMLIKITDTCLAG